MSFIFGLCSPAGVQSQVVPRKYTVSNGADQIENNSPQRKVDVIRLKPQPVSSDAAIKSSSLSIEEELYLFALDVKHSSTLKFSVNWLGGSIEALSAYTFDHNNAKSTNGLIILLRNVVGRYKSVHYDGFMAPSPDFSRSFSVDTRLGAQVHEAIPSHSSACKALTQLLNSYLANGDDNKAVSSSMSASSPRNFGNGFNNLQNVLKVADIFLLAILEHTSSSASLDDSIFFDVLKLCRILVAYYLSTPAGSAHSNQGETAGIFAQILCKCCHFASTLYQYADGKLQSQGVLSAAVSASVHTALEDAAQMTQIVAEGILFLNSQLAQSAGGAADASTEGSLQFRAYFLTMLYWQSCTDLLYLLQRIEHRDANSMSKSNSAVDVASASAAPASRWRTLQCRIFNAFHSTSPSAEQIQFELHRLQTYRLDSHLFSADQYCMRFLLPSYGAVPRITQREDSNIITVKSDLSAALAYGTSPVPVGPSDPNSVNGLLYLPNCTFRLRFLFTGLNSLFNAASSLKSPTMTSIPASVAMPGQISAKWAVSLAEMLLNILGEARTGNTSALVYAPYFAQQMLLLLHEVPATQSRGTNWIYWDLAKSLGEFTNLLRRQLRALDSHTQQGRHSSYSHNNGGGASVASIKLSHTEPTAALSKSAARNAGAGAGASGKIDRPLGALRSVSNSNKLPSGAHHIPSDLSTTSFHSGAAGRAESRAVEVKPLYSMGDKVDGQCTLANGSKRWYPGEVVQVITSTDGRLFTYKLRYNDGEERDDQPEADIRVPKKRKARGSVGNRTDDEDSGYDSGRIAHRVMSTDSMDSADAEAWHDRQALRAGQHGHAVDPRSRANSVGSVSVELPHNPAFPAGARAAASKPAEDLKGTNAALYRLQAQEKASHVGIGMQHRLSVTSVTSMKSVEEEGGRLRTRSAEHEAEIEVEGQAVDFSDDGVEAGDEADVEAGAGDSDADDEEDRVFEIPSVFEGGHRTMPPASINGTGGSKMFKEGLVPRIQFEDLDMSSGGLPHAFSNMSLSGALLSESSILRMSGNNIGPNGLNSFRTNNGDGTSRSNKAGMMSQMTSHRSYLDTSMQSVSGEEHPPFPHALVPHPLQNFDRAVGGQRNDPNFSDEPSTGGNTRLLTWRGAEDSTHFTASTMAISGRMPTTQPSSAYLAAQDRVLRKSSFHAPSSSRGAFAEVGSSLEEVQRSVPPQFKQYLGLGVGLEDAAVSTMLRTNDIVCAILLQRAVSVPDGAANSVPTQNAPAWLDSAACSSCGEFSSPLRPPCLPQHLQTLTSAGLNSSISSVGGGAGECNTNILFNVREYLEILPSSTSDSHNMSMFGSRATAASLNVSPESSLDLTGPLKTQALTDSTAQADKIHENLMLLSVQQGDASRRLCKMLSSACFKHSCLVKHMHDTSPTGSRLSEKIGEGGFGTVFKVTCNCSPGAYAQYSNCYDCHRRSHLFKGKADTTRSTGCCWKTSTSGCTSATKSPLAYAIKRVARERSMHDPSRLFDLFQEISALEILRDRHTIGVCGIEDYGVVGSEYWLVMELGAQNVEEWRVGLSASSPHSASAAAPPSPCALTMQQVASCLLLYIDALYIVESVHASDIAHFDLKSSNFVLRPAHRDSTKATLSLAEMCEFHASGVPSGAIFLADFGEAIPYISSTQGSAQVRTRCRGTLHTQSPEMLCISASGATSAPLLTVPNSTNSTVNNGVPGGAYSANPAPSAKSSKNPRKAFPLPDSKSDLWSMGCVLVELLTASQLFADKPWPELYITLCMENFSSLEILIPAVLSPALARIPTAVQSALAQLVLAAMQQLPADRPPVKSMITQAMALLQTHFREYLGTPEDGVHAHAVPPASLTVQSEANMHLPDLNAQIVSLTATEAAGPPIPCGSNVYLSFLRCTPRMPNAFSADSISHMDAPSIAGAALSVAKIDRDILLSSVEQCAQVMCTAVTAVASDRFAHEQVITLRVRSAARDRDGRSSPLPASNNLVFDLSVNPAADVAQLIFTLDKALQQVNKARAEASKFFVGLVTVVVAVEAEPQLPIPLTSDAGPVMWETNKLTVSIAAAVASILSLSSGATSNDHGGAERAMQQLVNLWRCLPRFQSYCDQEMVQHLVCACTATNN